MASVNDQLAALLSLSSPELRERWTKLTGAPPPRISPSLLRLALAWEIQARAHGGVSRVTQQRLAQLAAAKTRTARAQAGMRLVRTWNGVAHVVVVDEDQVIPLERA